MKQLLFFLCFCPILLTTAYELDICGLRHVDGGDTDPAVELYCNSLRFNGLLFHEALNQKRIRNWITGNGTVTKTFSELAPSIDVVRIASLDGVSISDTCLANLSKLILLQLVGQGNLSISANAFENSYELKALEIDGFFLTNDTVTALETLKNRLQVLDLDDVTLDHGDALLGHLSEFTKLEDLAIEDCSGCCSPHAFPPSIFQKSAKTLREIRFSRCPIGNLTRQMFEGLRNLKELHWTKSNLTNIENGAFDDLMKVKKIYLGESRIKWLSDGLFNNNRKLSVVSFGKRIKNFSRDNFTHVENFSTFRLF